MSDFGDFAKHRRYSSKFPQGRAHAVLHCVSVPGQTGKKRHPRTKPRPPTRAAVAVCPRIIFTHGVSRTSHQRGRTWDLGFSVGRNRGRCRTER